MNAPARIFEAKPAVREQVPLLIGLMGPSGGGKTFSALRLATGIQSVVGGEIYGIDTEARRMLHYADRFRFRHIQFDAPFGPLDYLGAIEHAVASGAKIIIVDSMSHEHDGPGGVLEMHAAELERLGGQETKKFLAWQKPKAMRRQMINRILQLNASFIFCFRAKDKIKIAGGKPIPQGFMPIAGEEFVFEMTANCLLLPHADGVPTWRSDEVGERLMMKLPEQFKGIFAESQPLSEDIGAALATWARGGTPGAAPLNVDQWLVDAREAADRGQASLQAYWKTISQEARKVVNKIVPELKDRAKNADDDTGEIIEDDPGGNRRPADGGGGNAAEPSATAAPSMDAQPATEGGETSGEDVAAPAPVDGSGPATTRALNAEEKGKLAPFAADLARMNRPADVMLRTQKFWQDAGLGDDDVSPLAVSANAIMDAHLGRTRGEISIDDATAAVRRVLPI